MAMKFVLRNSDRNVNQKNLAEGVKGVECQSAGTATEGEALDINSHWLTPTGFHARGVER